MVAKTLIRFLLVFYWLAVVNITVCQENLELGIPVLGHDLDLLQRGESFVIWNTLFDQVHIVSIRGERIRVETFDPNHFLDIEPHDNTWFCPPTINEFMGVATIKSNVLVVKRQFRHNIEQDQTLVRYLYYELGNKKLWNIIPLENLMFNFEIGEQFFIPERVHFYDKESFVAPIYVAGLAHKNPYLLTTCSRNEKGTWICSPYDDLFVPKVLNEKHGYDLMNSRINFPLFYMEGIALFHSFKSMNTQSFDDRICGLFGMKENQPLNYFIIYAYIDVENDREIVHAICAINNSDRELWYFKFNLKENTIDSSEKIGTKKEINDLTWCFTSDGSEVVALSNNLTHFYKQIITK